MRSTARPCPDTGLSLSLSMFGVTRTASRAIGVLHTPRGEQNYEQAPRSRILPKALHKPTFSPPVVPTARSSMISPAAGRPPPSPSHTIHKVREDPAWDPDATARLFVAEAFPNMASLRLPQGLAARRLYLLLGERHSFSMGNAR